MKINKAVSLAGYSTMRLGGVASYLIEVDSQTALQMTLDWAKDKNLKVIMIGAGSNIVWKDEGFKGLVIVNRIRHFDVRDNASGAIINIGAGENWDEVVGKCCDQGLSGIECLSLIPGTAGATPVQNVGAYGQEIANVLESVEVFDTKKWQFVRLIKEACGFSYRHSRFKDEPGRFYIVSLKLKLTKTVLAPPFYTSLESYLTKNKVTDYSPNSIRQAVIKIRQAKLPDPSTVNNCGSFFANPIISTILLEKLEKYLKLEIPHWPAAKGQQKVSAAWLVEKVGYRDFHDPKTGIGTWPAQPLVLVNESAKSTADLLEIKKQIIDKVKAQFGITLVQEPDLLP